jgi:hypothetical protein
MLELKKHNVELSGDKPHRVLVSVIEVHLKMASAMFVETFKNLRHRTRLITESRSYSTIYTKFYTGYLFVLVITKHKYGDCMSVEPGTFLARSDFDADYRGSSNMFDYPL